MTFKQACKLLREMDFNKFHKRYKADSKYVLMGVEGRYIRKSDWPEGVYIIHKHSLYKESRSTKVVDSYVPEFINIGKCISKNNKKDDYEVVDKIPGDSIVLRMGEKGIWG